MFFTVNPPYKANIVFGSFLPHSYGSHKKDHPHQKTTHLISVFLTRSKRTRFYYIYISASNKNK